MVGIACSTHTERVMSLRRSNSHETAAALQDIRSSRLTTQLCGKAESPRGGCPGVVPGPWKASRHDEIVCGQGTFDSGGANLGLPRYHCCGPSSSSVIPTSTNVAARAVEHLIPRGCG